MTACFPLSCFDAFLPGILKLDEKIYHSSFLRRASNMLRKKKIILPYRRQLVVMIKRLEPPISNLPN